MRVGCPSWMPVVASSPVDAPISPARVLLRSSGQSNHEMIRSRRQCRSGLTLTHDNEASDGHRTALLDGARRQSPPLRVARRSAASGHRSGEYLPPVRRCPPSQASSRADLPAPILIEGARPPVALRGKPKGRAPRHPVRDPPGDACRWTKWTTSKPSTGPSDPLPQDEKSSGQIDFIYR